MNTTSKASNAFEAFFGIHELPPPPSPPTSPLPSLLPMPPPPPLLLLLPRVLASTLKARKLHWRNPTANIGIDIIGVRISQQRHGEHNTRTMGERAHGKHTHVTSPARLVDQCLSSSAEFSEFAVTGPSPRCRSARRYRAHRAGTLSFDEFPHYTEYRRRRCAASSRSDSSMMV